jgi:hypothetical protein
VVRKCSPHGRMALHINFQEELQALMRLNGLKLCFGELDILFKKSMDEIKFLEDSANKFQEPI